jgi:hypothetical protein
MAIWLGFSGTEGLFNYYIEPESHEKDYLQYLNVIIYVSIMYTAMY